MLYAKQSSAATIIGVELRKCIEARPMAPLMLLLRKFIKHTREVCVWKKGCRKIQAGLRKYVISYS